MPKPPGGTPVVNFRLSEDVKSDLDLIAEHHTATTGIPCTRTDAVRIAVKREADRIRKSNQKGK